MRASLFAFVMAVAGCGSKQPVASGTGGQTTGAPDRHRDDNAGADRPHSPDSPYDAGTWIAKLSDPKENERAVTELEQLGNPAAIKPLGELWERGGRPVRVLQVIISLARPLTAEEARATYMTDYEKTGRKASWDVAMPFFVMALTAIDEANPHSVDSAQKAADALGEAQLSGETEKAGVAALVALAKRPTTKRTIAAQVAAIRALGKHPTADVTAALVELISREGPPHPRTVDPAARREAETAFGLYLAVTGASINAVAEHRAKSAALPLVLAMYRTPELFTQVRRALVASGPDGKALLRQALAGKQPDVNALFKAKRLGEYCGDTAGKDGMGVVGAKAPSAGGCHPVSLMAFYAALVLGDYYDAAVVPELLAVLKTRPLPPYYADDVEAPTTQFNAVFDALARIGAANAAAPTAKIWRDKKADVLTRTLAVAAYPYLARDASAVKDLGAIAADNTAEDQLRIEAASAFARLAITTNEIKVLDTLAGKYHKAVKDMAKEAAAAKTDGDRKMKERNGKAYLGYARMFQTHIARIDLGVHCKTDLSCYADALKLTTTDVNTRLGAYIPDLKDWSSAEKNDLYVATIDRALIEIGKAGAKATHLTDTLLDLARSDNRSIRQGVLRALPKIATVPCAPCVTKLDDAIKAGEGKTSLGDLNIETAIVRNYFVWAGK